MIEDKIQIAIKNPYKETNSLQFINIIFTSDSQTEPRLVLIQIIFIYYFFYKRDILLHYDTKAVHK